MTIIRPLLVAVVMAGLAGGCMARPKLVPIAPPSTQPGAEATAKPAAVQQAVMVFVDRFIPTLAEAYDYIEQNSKTPEARSAALSRKIGGALAAMKNAVNPNPYAGLLDMVVMVTLMSDTADKPAAKQLFGPYGQRLTTTLAAQKDEIWTMASQFVTEAQLQELRESIKDWEASHPNLQYVAFVRINQFPETRQINSDSRRRPNSVFGLLFLDPLSNLDPAVREFEMSRQLVERAFFYLQRMPVVISWQTDQMFTEMLSAPEVQSTVAGTTIVATSTTRFAEATERFASSVEKFRSDIPTLRQDALDQAEQGVARQRDAAVRQATTQISAERDAAVRQIAAALRTEQGQAADNLQRVLDRSIDRIYQRSLMLVCAIFIACITFSIVHRKMRSGMGRRLTIRTPQRVQAN